MSASIHHFNRSESACRVARVFLICRARVLFCNNDSNESEVRYCRISQYQSVLSFLIYQKFCHTLLAVSSDNIMIYHF